MGKYQFGRISLRRTSEIGYGSSRKRSPRTIAGSETPKDIAISKKVSVEGETGHIKRSVAHLLVRRLVAEWVVLNVSIRRLITREPSPMNGRFEVKKPYIPEKMPPREVPNVYFQPPQSDTWKLQHRNVSL